MRPSERINQILRLKEVSLYEDDRIAKAIIKYLDEYFEVKEKEKLVIYNNKQNN